MNSFELTNWWNKYKNQFNGMKGDVGMSDQKETRHSLESNPVPTSIFDPKRAMMAIKLKMDVGTGLDSRLCLVSIIFSDLTSLHPPSFHWNDFYTC